YQYLWTAEADWQNPSARGAGCQPAVADRQVGNLPHHSPAANIKTLRILHLGDFSSSWRHETLTAKTLEALGHTVTRLHEYLIPSSGHVLAELTSGRHDCLLFYKGRIAARTPQAIFE